ncbi:hypothetical protein DFH27DRAFT_529553 [Peziza echinospora]|nr:hypothetical protein DFH27DRAFT_529553 [Peziza echinospora]
MQNVNKSFRMPCTWKGNLVFLQAALRAALPCDLKCCTCLSLAEEFADTISTNITLVGFVTSFLACCYCTTTTTIPTATTPTTTAATSPANSMAITLPSGGAGRTGGGGSGGGSGGDGGGGCCGLGGASTLLLALPFTGGRYILHRMRPNALYLSSCISFSSHAFTAIRTLLPTFPSLPSSPTTSKKLLSKNPTSLSFCCISITSQITFISRLCHSRMRCMRASHLLQSSRRRGRLGMMVGLGFRLAVGGDDAEAVGVLLEGKV